MGVSNPAARLRSFGLALALSLACGAGGIRAAEVDAAPPWREKVDPRVFEDARGGTGELLVILRDQAELRGLPRDAGKRERTQRVVTLLREHALRTQGPLLALLDALGIEHRSFWIANMVRVREADAATVERLARRPDVLRIETNAPVRLPPSEPADAADLKSTAAVEWNISLIGVEAAWQMGFDGTGVVIGVQDTGIQWQHPALASHYRGWNGTTANHNYSWHDAIHSGGGFCGANSPQPCDDDSHGTHVTGILVGDDGGVNRIGVAPGARFIGCRNMDQAVGTPTTYAECFQWMIAPTDLAGANPDPSRAPDVINNSWVCLASEGCSPTTLRTIVENVRAAGIVVVAAAGNTGPGCATVSTPVGIFDASFTVGATDSSDLISFRSSRGPVTVDGSGRRKPDVVAPGVAVRSSVPFDSYRAFSGTSMATPHAAGLVALLLDARPDLRGRVDEIEALVALSAEPFTTLQGCGGDTGNAIPNNTFGWGRVDAERLFLQDADGDGSSNLADCGPLDAAQWSAPGAAASLEFDVDRETLVWTAPAAPGATELRYDLLRSPAADDLGAATCIADSTVATSAADPDVPAGIFFYLVRTLNACGSSLGESSLGPRSAPDCTASQTAVSVPG